MPNRPDTQRFVAVVVVLTCLLTIATAKGDVPRLRELTFSPEKREWLEVPAPPVGTAEGDLHRIRLQIKDGKYSKALRAVGRFVKKYGEDDAQYPGVLIAKAETLIGKREYFKAYGVVQSFMDRFEGMDLTSEAIRLEFVIAETFCPA